MSEPLNTGLPSTRWLQSPIKDKVTVELKLVTGESLTGTLLWQDPAYLCLQEPSGTSTLLLRQAVAYIRPQS